MEEGRPIRRQWQCPKAKQCALVQGAAGDECVEK